MGSVTCERVFFIRPSPFLRHVSLFVSELPQHRVAGRTSRCRQFCGVYASLAADSEGHARLSRGDVILDTLKAAWETVRGGSSWVLHD